MWSLTKTLPRWRIILHCRGLQYILKTWRQPCAFRRSWSSLLSDSDLLRSIGWKHNYIRILADAYSVTGVDFKLNETLWWANYGTNLIQSDLADFFFILRLGNLKGWGQCFTRRFLLIALNSCVCKLLVKMGNIRLVYLLVQDEHLSLAQHGFRRSHSTLVFFFQIEGTICGVSCR